MSKDWVQLDSRKRVSLGKIADSDLYRVTKSDSGTITLEPLFVVLINQDYKPLKDYEVVE